MEATILIQVDDFDIPDDRYYTEQHEWVIVEDKGLVKVGITDYAQKQLHEIVYVETPDAGRSVARMEALGTAESVKAVSEVFSPISGVITAVNQELAMSPELVNQDPYGKGWIAMIQASNIEAELQLLLNPTQYAEHLTR